MITKKLLSLLILGTVGLSACTTTEVENIMMEDDPMLEDETMMEEEAMLEDEAMMASSEAQYLQYSDELYSELKGSEPFALFFHAEWCPTCLAMEKDIKAELSNFPEGTKIVEIDYDNSDELQKAYGVNSQSVIIIIDKEGNAVETLAAPNNTKIIEALEPTLI